MPDMGGGRRHALVTGATGFIGASLCQRLVAEGWDVHVLCRKKSKLDILEPVTSQLTLHAHDGTTEGMLRIVGHAKPDVVFHLASFFLAQHQADDIEALVSSNILFSVQLAEAMAIHSVKYLVNTSTSWQHYETASYCPVNLYAATKQAAEDVFRYYKEAHGLSVITLVIFDTYGPADPRPKLIPLLWKAALGREPVAMSPGDQKIDLVHVSDVVDAYLTCALRFSPDQGLYERFGLSTGAPINLRELVKIFEDATQLKVPILWGGRPYRQREVMAPWSGYPVLPSWHPRISLLAGIPGSRPAGFMNKA